MNRTLLLSVSLLALAVSGARADPVTPAGTTTQPARGAAGLGTPSGQTAQTTTTPAATTTPQLNANMPGQPTQLYRSSSDPAQMQFSGSSGPGEKFLTSPELSRLIGESNTADAAVAAAQQTANQANSQVGGLAREIDSLRSNPAAATTAMNLMKTEYNLLQGDLKKSHDSGSSVSQQIAALRTQNVPANDPRMAQLNADLAAAQTATSQIKLKMDAVQKASMTPNDLIAYKQSQLQTARQAQTAASANLSQAQASQGNIQANIKTETARLTAPATAQPSGPATASTPAATTPVQTATPTSAPAVSTTAATTAAKPEQAATAPAAKPGMISLQDSINNATSGKQTETGAKPTSTSTPKPTTTTTSKPTTTATTSKPTTPTATTSKPAATTTAKPTQVTNNPLMKQSPAKPRVASPPKPNLARPSLASSPKPTIAAPKPAAPPLPPPGKPKP